MNRNVNSRREFIVMMAGAAAVAPRNLMEAQVPKMLDHILLGCANLERGVAFVEEKTGVKAAFGGVHPGRGTQNALLSLGERQYLEIIAPDPEQRSTVAAHSFWDELGKLKEPRLVTWAAHPGNLVALSAKLAKAGVVADGPTPGSRKRPDGKLLQWKTLNLKEDAGGILPFFIEWGAESVHPSVDAPKGCALEEFWAESPKPQDLEKQFASLGLEVEVKRGDMARLAARIAGPKGNMELRG